MGPINPHRGKLVSMSLEEAESVIYGHQFFDVQRSYSNARMNCEYAIQEAEQNLKISTNMNSKLTQQFRNVPKECEVEIQDIFHNRAPSKSLDIEGADSCSYYSKSNSHNILRSKSLLNPSLEPVRSLPPSPTMERRSLSLTPEPGAQDITSRQYDTVHANYRDSLALRGEIDPFGEVSQPLYRAKNICLTSIPHKSTLKSPNEANVSQITRLHRLRAQNAHSSNLNHMTIGYGSVFREQPFQSANMGTKTTKLHGSSNLHKRLIKQITLPEPYSLDISNIKENVSLIPPKVDQPGERRQKTIRFEKERAIHYYIVGKTNNT